MAVKVTQEEERGQVSLSLSFWTSGIVIKSSRPKNHDEV